jgi:hypothetical protein
MSEYIWQTRDNAVSGLLKFSPLIKLEELQQLALEWAQEEDADYQYLFISGCGKDGALGIYLVRNFSPEDSPEEMQRVLRRFVYKITDQLKRRFGNDFVGWDLSFPVYFLFRQPRV